MTKLQRPSTNLDSHVCMVANEMLNAVTTIHKLHLKITGLGSFAAHLALNDFYDQIGEHADSLVEKYQGASEKLLDIPDTVPVKLNSVDDAIIYLKNMHDSISSLQAIMPYSEIVNLLDEAKSDIDKCKYKLKFLK